MLARNATHVAILAAIAPSEFARVAASFPVALFALFSRYSSLRYVSVERHAFLQALSVITWRDKAPRVDKPLSLSTDASRAILDVLDYRNGTLAISSATWTYHGLGD